MMKLSSLEKAVLNMEGGDTTKCYLVSKRIIKLLSKSPNLPLKQPTHEASRGEKESEREQKGDLQTEGRGVPLPPLQR